MKRDLILRCCRLPALTMMVAWGVALGLAAQGQGLANTNALTLREALRFALANSPRVRASGARVDAAAGRAYQARKWTNPELGLSAEDWPVSGGQGFSDAKQLIGITQTLPWPGKKKWDREVGRAGVKLSEAELSLRQTELARDVKAAFYGVLAAERRVRVAGELVQVAASSAKTARQRVDAGATAYQEQLRAEIQLEQARTEYSSVAQELSIARETFAAILGKPDVKSVPLSGTLAEHPDRLLMERATPENLQGHPSLRAAAASLEQTESAYRRARLAPYPDVKVGVAGGRIGETDQSIIQLGFSIPLPILDTSKGRKAEARANISVAEADQHGIQLDLQRELANALERYRTATAQVASYRERIVPKALEALQLVQTGFAEGKFNFMDLLDTQRTTAEVQLAYQQKLLELNLAQAEVEALVYPTSSNNESLPPYEH